MKKKKKKLKEGMKKKKLKEGILVAFFPFLFVIWNTTSLYFVILVKIFLKKNNRKADKTELCIIQ